jgi:DNA-binding NtrC family response regulator
MEREPHKIFVIDDEIGTPDSPERTAFLRAVGFYPSTGGKKQVEGYPYSFDFHTGQSDAGVNSVEAVKDAVLRRWPSSDGKRWTLVLLDVRFGRDEKFGFTLLRALRDDSRFGKDLPIVMLTSEGKGKKDEASKLEATGFFPKADESGKAVWSEEGLRQRVLKFGLIPDDRDESLLAGTNTTRLLGRSLGLLKVLRDARKYALDLGGNRVLYGETGTGKTELAGYIHCHTGRSGRYVHWFADPANKELMKAELFGWWKKAFHGADSSQAGKVEEAHAGTFFLDEVANLPGDIQMALLQFRKQDAEGQRILSRMGKFPRGKQDEQEARQSVVPDNGLLTDHRIRVDVLLLTGTNERLEEAATRERKGFRDDLHRALGTPLECPKLNERREDIPELFQTFVGRALKKPGKPAQDFEIEAAVIDLLRQRDWSQRGNVADLERIAQYAAQQLGDFDVIRIPSLPPDVLQESQRTKSAVGGDGDVEANGVTAVVAPKQTPTSYEGSSAHGSLTRAELEHLRRRAQLLEEAAEASRKENQATGTKGRCQPTAAVTRLMGNKVTGVDAKRIIQTNILGPILNPKKKMVNAYGKKELEAVREWVESRPVLMSLYRYAIGEISADEIC